MKRRLGEMLIDAKVITPEQLETALRVQRESGSRLGEVLVGLGYITEVQLAETLAEQLGIPYLRLVDVKIDPRVARLISKEMAARYRVVPIAEEDGRLVLAMSDPLDVYAADEVSFTTGKEVKAVVMNALDIERAISQVYETDPIPADRYGETAEVEETETYTLGSGEDDSPAVNLVHTIIDRALRERASDIHLEPQEDGVRVRYRIDGVLREVMKIPRALQAPCTSRIKIMASMDISIKRQPQDGRIQLHADRGVDLRVSSLPTIYGEKIVIRILDKHRVITDVAELGFSEGILPLYREMLDTTFGMILVTGPTGCGKTTTLMASLSYLNKPEVNIVTIEDPVEYNLPGVNQVQVNRKAGLTFAAGLRSILRQDPDIIMVGEIRDQETADIAIRAALTGHLVFSTLHTNDAVSAVVRLIDMGVEPFRISASVIGAVAQRLVRKLCPACARKYRLEPGDPRRLGLPLPEVPLEFAEPVGCSECAYTGYHGQTALFEVLRLDAGMREMVSKGMGGAELRRKAKEAGMLRLIEDGVDKARAGITSLEEVRRVAYGGS